MTAFVNPGADAAVAWDIMHTSVCRTDVRNNLVVRIPPVVEQRILI